MCGSGAWHRLWAKASGALTCGESRGERGGVIPGEENINMGEL